MQIECPEELSSWCRTWLPVADIRWISAKSLDIAKSLVDGSAHGAYILPLEVLPSAAEMEDQVIGALSPRYADRIELVGETWEAGRYLWLPESALVYDRTLRQKMVMGNEISFGAEVEASHTIHHWWEEGKAGKKIHPAECTPPSGFGVLALVVPKVNLELREWAVAQHDADVALCTNIERKLQFAVAEFTPLNAHIQMDKLGRFNMFYKSSKGGGKITQNTWVGLFESALKEIKTQHGQ